MYHPYSIKLSLPTKVKHMFLGCVISIFSTLVSGYLLFNFILPQPVLNFINFMPQHGTYGELLALGGILNISIYFYFLYIHKEYYALGGILSTIILTYGLVYLY